jgi:signal transduction histidine kinase
VGIAADFAEQNLPEILPKDVALCLYRVAQESLRNIRKHSQATHVHVQLAGTPSAGPPDGILLRVVDEGNGFELEQALKKGGLGIISMEERVRLLGGQLTIHSQPGLGTTVMASVPLTS